MSILAVGLQVLHVQFTPLDCAELHVSTGYMCCRCTECTVCVQQHVDEKCNVRTVCFVVRREGESEERENEGVCVASASFSFVAVCVADSEGPASNPGSQR